MSDEHQPRRFAASPLPSSVGQVGTTTERELRAQRHIPRTVWFGLGMIELVAWSVAAPMLLGAALGVWLDKHYTESQSWTLTLLFVGLAIGYLNAWHLVTRENRKIRAERERDDG